MKGIVQRVSRASVKVDDAHVASIGAGILLLLGIHKEDTTEMIKPFVEKLLKLRIFEDEEGKMNRSLLDVQGELLVVSQFTLYGNTKKGNRPSFIDAMQPKLAEKFYYDFVKCAREQLEDVQLGIFGAHMEVSLCNDGPVTLQLQSERPSSSQ